MKLSKYFSKRDNNYYCGLLLLALSVISLLVWLLSDAYEPLSVLITFLLSFFGFSLLWKSDNDYRFKLLDQELRELYDSTARVHITPGIALRRRRYRQRRM